MKKFKINKNKQGAALMTVIVVMALVMILVVSALSVATSTQQQAYSRYNYQQAYYTAKSTLDAVVTEIRANDDIKTKIKNMSPGSSPLTTDPVNPTKISFSSGGNTVSIGTVDIKIEKVGEKLVKVTATAYYNEVQSNAIVYLDADLNKSKALINSAVVTLGNGSFDAYYNSSGGMVARTGPDKTLKIGNGEKAYGNIYNHGNLLFATGDVTINQGTTAPPDEYKIEATGDITVTNGASVYSEADGLSAYINAGKSFKIDNAGVGYDGSTEQKRMDVYCNTAIIGEASKINGDVIVSGVGVPAGDPACTITNGTLIKGDLYVDGNLLVVANNVTVEGKVYVTGEIKYNSGATLTAADKIIGSSAYIPPKKDLSDMSEVFEEYDSKPAESMIKYPLIVDDLDILNPITTSGKLPNVAIGAQIPNREIIINVGADPLYIMIPKDFKDENEVNIFVERTLANPNTPVYFCVEGGGTVDFDKTYIGSKAMLQRITDGDVFDMNDPDFFGEANMWLLEKDATVQLRNDAFISGYVYGPEATFYQDTNGKPIKFNNGIGTKTFNVGVFGGAVVGHVTGGNKNSYLYIPMPDELNPDPDDDSLTWKIKGYTRN